MEDSVVIETNWEGSKFNIVSTDRDDIKQSLQFALAVLQKMIDPAEKMKQLQVIEEVRNRLQAAQK